MNVEELREHCLSIKGSVESISLQVRNILVFKVMGKIFVYIPLEPEDGIFKVYLKCDPNKSVELREKYNGVNPDDFKTLLWNWITLESDVPNELIKELVNHSVDEVIQKLSKKKRAEYLGIQNT
ncbi:MmcQ/YjbR family DNA-binding protein [Dysgonomonas sp. BGC7]|uniref:MmcQ/YjbR family DNA-binding protein n=1 Tax=Dysgonomonas sp. BGC7 TaxID=1658008 RepID=UPI0006819789|nr:MmcQ/YjbR family DNA-binding protein [Dysgonomonas sp. BGC7]MBD8388662.1 MmcQ/YjbR family DNA-binding protein [Dysgonomonas sp. BGC7]